MKIDTEIHIRYLIGLKGGSHKDFNKLYDIYADLLYGFVLNLTKSPTSAKDILQETFLRIWINRETISLDMSFKSYMYTIARNLIIDNLRKKVESVEFESYILSDNYQKQSENTIEDVINYDQFVQQLNQAKQKLTDRQRIIFELHKEKGLPIAIITQRLQLSEKTVRNQLSLAMKTLRTELSLGFFLFFILFNIEAVSSSALCPQVDEGACSAGHSVAGSCE